MSDRPFELAQQVTVAQSILASAAAAEAARLEWAQAATCRAVAAAMARRDPASGAGALESPAGMAIYGGDGSPLTQGMAMGLRGPVSAADLDAIEAHLRRGGTGPSQLELSPFADPTLLALVAERRYRITEWQLVWTRAVPAEPLAPPPPELTVRPIRAGEEELHCRVSLAGFLESEDVPAAAVALLLPLAFADGCEPYLALFGDEPIAAAMLCVADGIAFLGGTGVRPAFRRRGAQGALIRARLERARALACTIACSNTQPGTASRRNMERHGFAVAYPKIVLVAP
jgi:GNAT superfamily N-acetyltransferase